VEPSNDLYCPECYRTRSRWRKENWLVRVRMIVLRALPVLVELILLFGLPTLAELELEFG